MGGVCNGINIIVEGSLSKSCCNVIALPIGCAGGAIAH